MEYKIINKKSIFKNKFLELENVDLQISTFSGETTQITRIGMIRPAVISVLLYHEQLQSFIFVEQFRYSAIKINQPWITEVIAGVVDEGENIKEAAIRECIEETGYQPQNIELIQHFMPSVGVSDQIIYFFYATTNDNFKINEGGGLAHENEDINIIFMEKEQCFDKLAQGLFHDSKTMIALNWYFLFNQPRK